MPDEFRLTCVSRSDPHVEGSILGNCLVCNTEVWVSPTGQQIVKEYDAKLLCFECTPEDAEILPPTPEQLKAIEGELL